MDVEDRRNVDTKWFQDRMRAKGMSLRGLAKLMELDHAALSRIFHGHRKVNGEELAQIANLLGAPINEVMARFGLRAPASAASAVTLIGTVDSKGEVHPSKGGTMAPPQIPGGAVSVRNEDPSSLTFGWTYFYELRSNVDRDTIGKLCVVKLKDGRQLLRIVRNGLDPNTYLLISSTTGDIETAGIVSASPVIWIRT